jgi:hypothetical protein
MFCKTMDFYQDFHEHENAKCWTTLLLRSIIVMGNSTMPTVVSKIINLTKCGTWDPLDELD